MDENIRQSKIKSLDKHAVIIERLIARLSKKRENINLHRAKLLQESVTEEKV